jgi:Anthranilate/para-aminobenzoate synthases component I
MSEKNSRRNVESKKATVSRNGTVVIALPLKSLTPLDVYRLTRDANKPSALFEKYDRACASPQHSIVALEPEKVIYVQNGVATIEECAGASLTCRPITCPFSFLSEILEQIAPVDEPLSELDMAFSSGLVGYLGYGLTSLVEKIDRQEINPFMVPDLGMILPSTIVYFDHVQGKTVIVSRNGSQHAEALRDALVAADRRQPVIAEPDSPKESLPSFELRPGFESAISKDAFLDRVRQTREYIEEGQAFQIVVSQRFYAPITIDAIDIYEELIGSTPSTYNYLLDFNSFQYLGASPETMMNCQNRKVRICALAGTRPRGTTYDEDISNEVELRQNEKEMAEHMMLVDLGRNDLGRICHPWLD